MDHLTHPIHHHIAFLERAIAGAFLQNGLAVQLCGNVQGPHTITVGLRLHEATQRNLNKALRLAGAVEAAVTDSPVRLYLDRGVILVETPSPVPQPVDGRRLRGQGLALPLGVTSRQTVCGVDLMANPHLLLVGPTNRGKTTAARLLAYHLAKQNSPQQLRMLVTTFKPQDWQAFATLAHTVAVITDPHEAAQMIDYLMAVMYSRTKAKQETPHLVLFLDDLLNLLGVAPIDQQLAQLASLGRGAGIHLIVGTQRLGEKGAAGSLVTGNMPTRLVFGTADTQDAARFTGRGGSGAERLGRYPGDALLVTDGGTQRLAVGYLRDGDLAGLPQSAADYRPWQRSRKANERRANAQEKGNPVASAEQPAAPTPVRVAVAPAAQAAAQPVYQLGQKLPVGAPDAPARRYLRQLYADLGSKKRALLYAWGGVVNATGKTARTVRWLEEALAER